MGSMQLTQSAGMRMEQRQLLTPRMIQSMEILQMPLTALEERIEQELEKNPVLEVAEARADRDDLPAHDADVREENQALDLDTRDEASADDFARLDRISDYLENEEFSPSYDRAGGFDLHGPSTSSYAGERDAKLDAMNNTAARGVSLDEHLLEQWNLIDHCSDSDDNSRAVCRAGRVLIGYLDDRGYLPMELIEVRDDALSRGRTKDIPALEAFEQAFGLIRRQLEPAGVGATSLPDCLLLQLDSLARDEETAEGHDFDLERQLVTKYLKDLEQNRYPQIAKKTGRDIPELQAAVKRLGRLHPHPGKLIAPDEAPPITPDATIRWDDDLKEYTVSMARDPAPDLQIRALYKKLLRQSRGSAEANGQRNGVATDASDDADEDDLEVGDNGSASTGKPLASKEDRKQLREFLGNNVRNARWLIESIEQRRGTIERVIRKVLEHQRDFFDKGPESLKPLPMIGVAEELGIHVATVSRAVSEKWIDTPRGLFPLRRFFSGGTTTEDGQDMSWDAVKEKLRAIIEREDKAKPLNDDEIVEKLDEQGIELARRTVAKYRKILNIATARQRKTFD